MSIVEKIEKEIEEKKFQRNVHEDYNKAMKRETEKEKAEKLLFEDYIKNHKS